jgi:toxin ParE1/3/4
MGSFYLTKKAKQDLENIAKYTSYSWGVKQRNLYLSQIDSVFNNIAVNHNIGQSCDDFCKGYFKFVIQKHVVFYKIGVSEEICIVRILHSRMDIDNYL